MVFIFYLNFAPPWYQRQVKRGGVGGEFPRILLQHGRWLETVYAWNANPSTGYVRGALITFCRNHSGDSGCKLYFITSFISDGAFVPGLILVLNRDRQIKLTRFFPFIPNLHHPKIATDYLRFYSKNNFVVPCANIASLKNAKECTFFDNW